MTDTEETKSLESMDIDKLLSILPHRYPFLLIDRIIEIDGDQEAIGIKNVTINEPHFTGHFPEKPVMPGVLILEAMAQTAGAISLLSLNSKELGLVYLMTVDNAKFRKPVTPGDQLKIHVRLLKKRSNIRRFLCIAKVEDVRVAEAEVSAMIVESK
ncbi:3-hydroxyacyl-[acyl-carrier-protein] dehydratase [Bartonella sp. CDC_skunk]|uniref:3-hydroxyacyl-[acyl-carrier-protein] dehydratase FabZ n=1 Tax=Bartonella rochalimae ATCC BAA-1498 TaxID=685782 RepID=E6YM61_9HYPH|nr:MULTISPECIES: 3-hydroxyacyl-ACP dehydratase FabZ [Bartonella]AQX18240.1 3-hydroxyacyl-[acyl-carrier-protein] dehydratase [Bartonella sp. A1379B]AQX21239.1 3-hydroxyacyl-[acyl-carrier-protein] dehydratase [Bartonella sp. CDC_skunk]AQX22755.1 3-hydroxyacyl-[acyl-carrier-protein] dehydratase [Bartonella sp. 11B]AQX23958.1 3-hydroxyacyl-[acyl-carrier-protein] dehydratase [Bartonella sp. 114]AQX25205.1 3-hydroxyacyl-[acyl-carrier-protein] dehydratase [Bartonella sp. Coyote22sub2]